MKNTGKYNECTHFGYLIGERSYVKRTAFPGAPDGPFDPGPPLTPGRPAGPGAPTAPADPMGPWVLDWPGLPG